jgi:hypothetical protein
MNLEHDLKRALRRESPAPGFAGRVLSRIEQPPQVRKRPVWWRAAAASVTLATLLGGYGAHKVAERREQEKAAEQVLLAMQIAGEKVRYAQQEVRGIGSHN